MIRNFRNTESCEDKASNTQKLSDSKLATPPHFYSFEPHFSVLTINKLKSSSHTFPSEKMLSFLNLFTAN